MQSSLHLSPCVKHFVPVYKYVYPPHTNMFVATCKHVMNMCTLYSGTSVIRTLWFHYTFPDYRGFHFKEVYEFGH